MGYSSLRIVSPPKVEPVSVADAKAHLRLDHSDDDSMVAQVIAVARSAVELYLDRALITQTLCYTLSPDQPPSAGLTTIVNPIIFVMPLSWFPVTGVPIDLPMAPVQAISSVGQRHRNGTTTVLDPATAYWADATNEPARVTLRGVGQPLGSDLVITYIAGYGDGPAPIPMPIIHAIKMLVAFFYERRGDEGDVDMPSAVKALLNPYRQVSFA